MPRELTPAEREELTPGELAAIMGGDTEAAASAALADAEAGTVAADRAAEAAGDNEAADAAKKAAATEEEGEGEGEEKPLADANAEAGTEGAEAAAAEGAEGEGEDNADAMQAVIDEAEAPAAAAPPPAQVKYKGVSQTDYEKQRGEIDTALAAGMKQLMDGEIDADAFAKIQSEQNAKRDDLVAARTLARANEEAEQQEAQTWVTDYKARVASLAKSTDVEGSAINYTKDEKAQKEFDRAVQLIVSDPDNGKMQPADVVERADRMVRALRNVAPAPAPTPAAPTPPAAKKGAREAAPPPTTLSGLPTAAPNNVGSDIRSQFSRLEGEEAEEFLARLQPNVRRALLDGAQI